MLNFRELTVNWLTEKVEDGEVNTLSRTNLYVPRTVRGADALLGWHNVWYVTVLWTTVAYRRGQRSTIRPPARSSTDSLHCNTSDDINSNHNNQKRSEISNLLRERRCHLANTQDLIQLLSPKGKKIRDNDPESDQIWSLPLWTMPNVSAHFIEILSEFFK